MAAFLPIPDVLTQPFWDGCRRGVINVQCCQSCRRLRHRPSAGCHWCGEQRVDWMELSGRATVYTYTIVHRAFHPSFADEVPYIVALVAAEEDPTVRFHTRIVECELSQIYVAMKVEVVFRKESDGTVLPFWRPTANPSKPSANAVRGAI